MHSLIGIGAKVAVMTRSTPLRRQLGRIRQRVTGADLEALRTQVAELSGELSTVSAQLIQAGTTEVPEVDVAIISDFRLPGGTTASIAEEARAQSAAGLSTALVHTQSAVTTTATGFSRHILGVLGLPGVHVVSSRAALHARLVIVRHPYVMETCATEFPRLRADQVVLVANHPAVDADGVWQYDMLGADAAARDIFGKPAEWAPISPVVRASIAEQGAAAIRMAEQDWVNVFGQELVTTPRSGFVAERPVIGRHSRPQKEKWPDTAEAILSAYPEDPRYSVEILGGADIPGQILGRIPQAWSVTPFGAEDPADFLQRIDFWVYAHHPKWREAFGRAVMEALAAGCLVVLPGYLREIFGNAALYAEPDEVRDLVDQYWQDREGFLEQTRRGQQFAIDHGPGRHVERLRWRGVTP
jgi:glycosyltransferase involved in cell wall biosynthesis